MGWLAVEYPDHSAAPMRLFSGMKRKERRFENATPTTDYFDDL